MKTFDMSSDTMELQISFGMFDLKDDLLVQ